MSISYSILMIGTLYTYNFPVEFAGLDLFNIFFIFGLTNIISILLYYIVKLMIIIINFLVQLLKAYYIYKMEELEQYYDNDNYDTNDTNIMNVNNISDIINIINEDILFTNLYTFIYKRIFRHLVKYTNDKDLATIPKFLKNGKQMKDIDRYIYSVLLTTAKNAKENKDLSFEYFLACIGLIELMEDYSEYADVKYEYFPCPKDEIEVS